MRVFPAQKPRFPPKAFRHPTSILLCDLRDLCAMLFPEACLSRPETTLSTKSPSALQSSISLCDLRAMLFPEARLSRPEAMLLSRPEAMLSTKPNQLLQEQFSDFCHR
jgi:hypothetical protein